MNPQGSWTHVDDLIAVLRKRWDRGVYLRAYAEGEPWSPVSLPVKGPNADDLLNRPDAAVRWIEQLRDASRTAAGPPRFEIEYRTVRSRGLGANAVPARIRIDTLHQLATLVDAAEDIDRLDVLIAVTSRDLPTLISWVAHHPNDALEHHDVWRRLLDTVRWILYHDTSTLDIRHLDVPGVDTKFVEQHRKILGRLLDQVLPPEQIDQGASDFASRYGFRRRPSYVRFRLLEPVARFPAGLTELEVRTDELAEVEIPVSSVFVVENKATYLAFPQIPGAIVIFGGGFAVTLLEAVPWLADRDVVYWGDIDTHGFAILHRLRQRVPTVRSILMDRNTLLAHRDQLVTEHNPTTIPLTALTPDESELYRDLIEDRYGDAVRLEQERIRFTLVRRALEPWATPARGD